MKRIAFALFLIGLFVLCTAASADTLVLPDDLTVIGDEAFMGDQSLDKVVLGENVTEIGVRAFCASSVKEINLPDSIEKIGYDAFRKVKNVTITANEGTYAWNWAVENGLIKDPLDDFYIIDGVIAAYYGAAMYDIEAGIDLVIPDKDKEGNPVIGIDQSVFKRSYITGVTIPETIVSIGDNCFEGCRYLKTVKVCGPAAIGGSAFCECTALEEVELAEGVSNIYMYAFSTCSSLAEISIPASVKTIEYRAFEKCENLVSASIAGTISALGPYAFYECSSLKTVDLPQTLKEIGEYAFTYCTRLDAIDIPEGVTKIGGAAFANCGLKRASLPQTLKEIGFSAFYRCGDLVDVSLPQGLTTLGERAFYETGIRSIVVPGGIKDIQRDTFHACPNLASIRIEEGVETAAVGGFTFCPNLRSLWLPDSMTSIDMSDDGHSTSLNYGKKIPYTAVIYGHPKSFAQWFANCYGYTFKPIEEGSEPVEIILPDAVSVGVGQSACPVTFSDGQWHLYTCRFGDDAIAEAVSDGRDYLWRGKALGETSVEVTAVVPDLEGNDIVVQAVSTMFVDLDLEPDPVVLPVGGTLTLSGVDRAGGSVTDGTWNVGDEQIATVQNGEVNALKPGTTTVWLTSGALTAQSELQVVKPFRITTDCRQLDHDLNLYEVILTYTGFTDEGRKALFALNPELVIQLPDSMSCGAGDMNHPLEKDADGNIRFPLTPVSDASEHLTCTFQFKYDKTRDADQKYFEEDIHMVVLSQAGEALSDEREDTVAYGREYGYILVSKQIAEDPCGNSVRETTLPMIRTLFDNSHFILLHGVGFGAGLDDFESAMAHFTSAMSEYDTFTMYMFAHGGYRTKEKIRAACSILEETGEGTEEKVLLEDSTLLNSLDAMPGRKVLITDVCYSGGLADSVRSTRVTAPEMYDNITIITAAAADEPALARWLMQTSYIEVVGPLANMLGSFMTDWVGLRARPLFLEKVYEICSDSTNYEDGYMTARRLKNLVGVITRGTSDVAHPQFYPDTSDVKVFSMDR